jgi:hypothetical protein
MKVKHQIIIAVLLFVTFVSGLFYGYWNVIHYQKIYQDENYYYVEFMGNEFVYYK